MWTFEHTETTTATPEQLWQLYQDPTTWPEWDHQIEDVTVDGPFEAGSTGTIKPVGGPRTKFRMVEVTEKVSFTDVTRLPLAKMRFDHWIRPEGGRRAAGRHAHAGCAGRAGVRPGSPSESPGFLLWRVTLAWQRAMAAVLREHDLTHVQFVLLANVWWLGDGPTQRQLADHAGTDPMMTSQVLRTVEGKGLVTRVVDSADSRARRVTLTSQGRALVDRALPDVDAADAAFFAAVPRDEVLAVLSRLGGHVRVV